MNLIDLEKARKDSRKKKQQAKKSASIGSRCKTEGSDGTYYKFSVTYQFKGRSWSFDIWAKSKKEAEQRAFAVKRFPVDVEQIISAHVKRNER